MEIIDFGIVEISSTECEKINGGNPWFFVGLFIAMLNDADNNPDDFLDGYNAVR
ncbi:hypothetical protein GW796_11570 [archaeon]|nr:hypothetical protein [archaeon]NCT16328.1 hypothetical protein [Flavobacteriales bacterium]